MDIRGLHNLNTPTSQASSSRNQHKTELDHPRTVINSQILPILAKSRWFTRGWTLQELLAPSHEVFFGTDWTFIGDRNAMSNWIADITSIHIGALKDRSMIPHYSIAQRMSWAATRQTTRSEDIAYCLLGIFGIHMPMLYGEGNAAFKRLQHEIMMLSDDHSIFAWNLAENMGELCTGALAPSPRAFLSCGSIVRFINEKRSPFTVTNIGISIEFPLIQGWYGGIDLVGLNCARELRGRDDPLDILPDRKTVCRCVKVWILLRRVQHKIYQRVHLPASTVLLQPSYIDSMEHAKTALFFTIQKSHEGRLLPLPEPLIPPIQKSIHNSPFSSGIMITLGWGTKNRFNRYEQAFNPGKFCSHVLKARSPMGISHQLVSNQNFSLLFSVAWNLSIQPQHWTHSVFVDPDRKFSSNIINADKWKCLFVESPRAFTQQPGDLVDRMSRIHEQLRHDFGEAFQHAYRLPITPTVLISPHELQNLYGQRELLIDIHFQESPKSGAWLG